LPVGTEHLPRPVEVITTMLGVPPENRQQLRLWSDKGLEREPGEFQPSHESVEAFTAGVMFYSNVVQQRRAKPQDDMISRLTQVDVAHDDGVAKLTDVEIAGFALMLGGAGAETVVKLIGNAAVTFAENPSAWPQRRSLRHRPDPERAQPQFWLRRP
jgi:cytochrome P450